MRFGFRLSVAIGLYTYGMGHAATVVGIVAAMTLVGTVEGQIAKTISNALPRAKDYIVRTARRVRVR